MGEIPRGILPVLVLRKPLNLIMPDHTAITDEDLKSFDDPPSSHVSPPPEEEHPDNVMGIRGLSPQERAEVCKAIGISPLTKGGFQHHIKLRSIAKKTKGNRTVGGEIRAAFEAHGINPAELLVKQIKMEASKIEVYERSEAHGVPQHVLNRLPSPNYERLDELLLKVMKFYVPTLASTEITGTIDHSLKINLVKFSRPEIIIEHDEKSPAHLLAQNQPTPLERGTEDGEIEVPLEDRMREEIEKDLQNTTLKAVTSK